MPSPTTHPPWTRRHLLSLRELSRDEIVHVLDAAQAFSGNSNGQRPRTDDLAGRVVVNAFFEDSTRTRVSFTLAAQRLGADVVDFGSRGSSVSKGESLVDTVKTIDAMGIDFLVIRHAEAGAAELVSRHVAARVINAGDGAHEHPTQGLLDALTIRQRLGLAGNDFSGLRVLIVGDILNSRVARSNAHCLTKLGARVTLCGPPALCPDGLSRLSSEGEVRVTHDFDAALAEADVVMMLRIQAERMKAGAMPSLKEYIAGYALTADRLQRCRREVLVMHPGPMNRGVEIEGSVADGPASAILQQVTNGVAVRMAVLRLISKAPIIPD